MKCPVSTNSKDYNEERYNEERQVTTKSKYSEIVKHIPSLEDHGHLYMYYRIPYSEECYVYGDDEEGNNLIVSYECDDLCRAIADKFQYEYKWLDVLHSNQIKLEKVFDVDVETQDFDVIASLVLDLECVYMFTQCFK